MSKSKSIRNTNKAAAALGRKGGKKSAAARFAGLSKDEVSAKMRALCERREELKKKEKTD